MSSHIRGEKRECSAHALKSTLDASTLDRPNNETHNARIYVFSVVSYFFTVILCVCWNKTYENPKMTITSMSRMVRNRGDTARTMGGEGGGDDIRKTGVVGDGNEGNDGGGGRGECCGA